VPLGGGGEHRGDPHAPHVELWHRWLAATDRGPHLATFLTDVDGDEYVFHLYDEPQHDPLTGLLIGDRIRQELLGLPSGSGEASLVLLGIDGMGQVNDAYGQALGEQALLEIARRLHRGTADRQCAALGRVGGDEFALLLAQTAPAEAAPLVEDLLVQVARSQRLGEQEVVVTATAGLAGFLPGGETEPAWLAAEEALAGAKRAGRDRLVVAPCAMEA
jgi:diguanylate cyclase (GGDEF)-like protein